MRRFGETPPTWTNEFLEMPSTVFLFAYRQSAGGTPAIRWSVIQFFCPQITQIRKIFFRDK
ncbi:MAG: hypothetical protein LBP59_13295 [Planctomycetaceae bacterium]|jgi:hypothetical protein|nr:hypothetical protein [Planctomycetaceae bacterium]